MDNLESLFEIWKQRNCNLNFYFQHIFNQALEALANNTTSKIREEIGKGRYKALFTPVGYSIENIALISGFIKPKYLMMAFSEKTRSFHRRHIDLVKENIKNMCPDMKIDEVMILSDDQKITEQKIVSWIEEMNAGYNLSNNQLAIDLTGGTKPMSIGAYNAAVSFKDVEAFYLWTDYDEDTQMPIPGTERLVQLIKEKSQLDEDFVFVIMPFNEEFNNVYDRIKEVVESLGMRCERVDEQIFFGGIMDKIKENLIKARIIIAELSEKNLNVYYELGLSHGYEKRVIMLTQDVNNLPFDLRHLRMVIYNKNNLFGLKEKLRNEIKSAL
ncbi:MAG: hypothetical protein AB1422_01075 [bacterium]